MVAQEVEGGFAVVFDADGAPAASGLSAQDMVAVYEKGREPTLARPWISANFVTSIDGSIASGGRAEGLSTSADRELFLALRAAGDLVLVGAGTATTENYGPVSGGVPLCVVGSGRSYAWADRLLEADAPVIAAVPAGAPDPPEGIDTIRCGTGGLVDVAVLANALRRKGHRHVMCEGGPMLLQALTGAGVVDEMCTSIAPVLGGDPLGMTTGLMPAARFHLRHVAVGDGTVFMRWTRTKA